MDEYKFDPKFALQILVGLWDKADRVLSASADEREKLFEMEKFDAHLKGQKMCYEFIAAALFNLNSPEGIEKWFRDMVALNEREDEEDDEV